MFSKLPSQPEKKTCEWSSPLDLKISQEHIVWHLTSATEKHEKFDEHSSQETFSATKNPMCLTERPKSISQNKFPDYGYTHMLPDLITVTLQRNLHHMSTAIDDGSISQ